MRKWLISAAFAVKVHAQAPPPIHTYLGPASAVFALDSMARVARANKKENGACLVSYGVVHDTLVIGRIGQATYVRSDSIQIFADGPLCPNGVPVIHTHIGFDRHGPYDQPSPIDLESSAKARTWAVLLVVEDTTWHLRLYP